IWDIVAVYKTGARSPAKAVSACAERAPDRSHRYHLSWAGAAIPLNGSLPGHSLAQPPWQPRLWNQPGAEQLALLVPRAGLRRHQQYAGVSLRERPSLRNAPARGGAFAIDGNRGSVNRRQNGEERCRVVCFVQHKSTRQGDLLDRKGTDA